MDNRIPLGPIKNFPVGKTRVVRVAERSILIYHAEDHQVYAVENRCSHLGLPLTNGKVEGTTITCPFHGSRFDLRTGENLDWVTSFAGARIPEWSRRLLAMGKKPAPIRAYRTSIEDDQLYLHL